MVKAETDSRLSLEYRELSEDKDVFIKAGKFKFLRDMEMYRKINQVKFTLQREQQEELVQIEMSKTSDAIFLEFGFDMQHLVRGFEKFHLTENEELMKFQTIVLA